jgi:hypothetical protein
MRAGLAAAPVGPVFVQAFPALEQITPIRVRFAADAGAAAAGAVCALYVQAASGVWYYKPYPTSPGYAAEAGTQTCVLEGWATGLEDARFLAVEVVVLAAGTQVVPGAWAGGRGRGTVKRGLERRQQGPASVRLQSQPR